MIDLAPTILEVTGGKRFETWQGQPVPTPPGKSLVSIFAQDGRVQRDYLWWQHEKNRAVRVGDWKLVASGTEAAWELYNLGRDRVEAKNLAASMPDKVLELDETWQRAAQRV